MKRSVNIVIKKLIEGIGRRLSALEIINMVYLLNWYSALLDEEYYTETFEWLTSPVCAISNDLKRHILSNNIFIKEKINDLDFISEVDIPDEYLTPREEAYLSLVIKEYNGDIDNIINLVKASYPFKKGMMNAKIDLLKLAKEYKNSLS
ncbi:hypothetical protein [Haemophilus paraphrohaemolyticus]|uniref:hypothetical protein n=1 Tax=Haemophilus paraphrohaemolyticus TaxID=736 RepID=UPI00352CF0EE